MNTFLTVDWHKLFVPSSSVLEIIIRGSITYFSLFALLRFILKRQAGTVGITDLLVLVLIADAAQNSMAGEYVSITEGIVLVTTIIFWSYVLNWVGYRFPALQRFVHPPPLMLVKEGRMLHRNMRQELITENELMSYLRQQGVDDLAQVKQAYMEGTGQISVVTFEANNQHPAATQRRSVS